MSLKRTFGAIVSLCGAIFSGAAAAVLIEYEVADLGDNDYRYEYTVGNDGSLVDSVELFSIDFDTQTYAEPSLRILTTGSLSGNWDEQILASAPMFPAAYDAYALGDGVAAGETARGFVLAFTWLGGPDGPGAQPFQVFDPFTYEVLAAGTTWPLQADEPARVPEPTTIALLMAGLVGCLLFKTRKWSRAT